MLRFGDGVEDVEHFFGDSPTSGRPSTQSRFGVHQLSHETRWPEKKKHKKVTKLLPVLLANLSKHKEMTNVTEKIDRHTVKRK